MSDVWHPVIELDRTANHDDTLEAAEEFKDDVGDDDRVVMVEAGDGEGYAYLERGFGDGGGGWIQIGEEANPNEDYFDVMIDVVNDTERDDIRLIFDYTNDVIALEQWVEPDG